MANQKKSEGEKKRKKENKTNSAFKGNGGSGEPSNLLIYI